MSLLTECLERILLWLDTNSPNSVEVLQAGLSISEIRNKTQHLGFDLPEELCELYQWRNGIPIERYSAFDYQNERNLFYIPNAGSCSFLPGHRFISLELALAQREHWLELNQSFMNNLKAMDDEDMVPEDYRWHEPIWQPSWLPIFSQDAKQNMFINLDKGEHSISWFIHGNTSQHLYKNLISMMHTTAECYETGAYYLYEGYIESSDNEEELIRQKYNSMY